LIVYFRKHRPLTVGPYLAELVPTHLSKLDPKKNGFAFAGSATFNRQPKQYFRKTEFIKSSRGIGVD